jgi:drug/metabolite transporter (DMT)-like permease
MANTGRPANVPSMTSPRTSTRSVSLTDMGLLLFLGAVWGGAYLFFRIAAPEVGPVWTAEIRLLIGATALALVAGRRALPVVRTRLRDFVIVGAMFSALPFSLLAFASLTLPTGFGALLNASTPLFTALLGVVLLGQKLRPRAVFGLAIGVAAVFVLVGWSPLEMGPGLIVASLAAMAAAMSYAFAGTFVRRRLHDVGGLELATGQLAFGALVLMPFALLFGAPGVPSAAGAASLLAVGLVSTALAWPIFFRVMSRTTPTAASTVTFIVPAFAITWGGLVLAEPVGPELLAGFGLILVSLVLVLGLRVPLPDVARRSRSRPAIATA